MTDADGVPVYLMRSGIIVDSATTSDGGYEFTAIEPGSYRVLSIIALASADTTLETVVRSDVTVADTLRLGPAGDITVIPNPFQSSVSATFAITAIDTVDVSVMNAAGQPIRTLAHGILPLGQHQIVWDGLYPNHSEAPDGAYWMVLSQGIEYRADLAFKDP